MAYAFNDDKSKAEIVTKTVVLTTTPFQEIFPLGMWITFVTEETCSLEEFRNKFIGISEIVFALTTESTPKVGISTGEIRLSKSTSSQKILINIAVQCPEGKEAYAKPNDTYITYKVIE